MQNFFRTTAAVLMALLASHASADQVTVDGRDFIPLFGDAVFGESSAGNLICTGPNGSQFYIAQLPLPPTPVELDLKQLAFWGGDFSATDAEVSLDRYCQNEFSPSTPVRTSIGSVSSSGNSGNYFTSATLNRRVDDQQSCVYMLSVRLGLNSCTGDSNLSVARIRVRFDVVPTVVIDPIFSNGFEN